MRYQYIFYFITVGSAIVCAILSGLFSLCSRGSENDFTFKKIFSPDFGLCNNSTQILENRERDSEESANNFKREQ